MRDVKVFQIVNVKENVLMKKLLALSMVVAWAFLAQAGESINYWVRITRIDQKELVDSGTLPGKVTMHLIDTSQYAANKYIYSKEIDFSTLYVKSAGITLGEEGYINANGRFDIAEFVKDYERSTAIFPNGGGAKNVTLAFDDQTSYYKYDLYTEFKATLDSDAVYQGLQASGLTMQKYANAFLRTIFEVDGETYELQINAPGEDGGYVINSSADKMDMKAVVPEPTSGLLLLMGLAGLALKRKQTK